MTVPDGSCLGMDGMGGVDYPVDPRQTTYYKEPGIRSVYGFSLWNTWLPPSVVTGFSELCFNKGGSPAKNTKPASWPARCDDKTEKTEKTEKTRKPRKPRKPFSRFPVWKLFPVCLRLLACLAFERENHNQENRQNEKTKKTVFVVLAVFPF